MRRSPEFENRYAFVINQRKAKDLDNLSAVDLTQDAEDAPPCLLVYAISDEMRAVVEELWPELTYKLPPKQVS